MKNDTDISPTLPIFYESKNYEIRPRFSTRSLLTGSKIDFLIKSGFEKLAYLKN